MAQLDVHLTGDQEFVGWTPMQGGQHSFIEVNFLQFLQSFSPLILLIQKG